MRILFIADRAAFPPESGTDLRHLHVLNGLRAAGRVTMALLPPKPLPPPRIEATRSAVEDLHILGPDPETSGAPKKRLNFEAEDAGGIGAPLAPTIRTRLAELGQGQDLIWIERLALALRCGYASGSRVAVDLDDLNFAKYQLAASAERRWSRRLRLHLATRRWRAREITCPTRFGGIAVCSTQDRRILGDRENVVVIPNGYDSLSNPPRKPGLRIGFIGTLEYWANRDGLCWFLESVWPTLRERLPGIEFRIVGKGRRSTDLDGPGLKWLGFVDDVAEEFSTWSAMVVPLRIGGGTRIKILEAFSRGCPVVSTSVGAYGLDAVNGQHLLLADQPNTLVSALGQVVQDAALQRTLISEASKLFQQSYAWDRIEQSVASMASQIARRRPSS